MISLTTHELGDIATLGRYGDEDSQGSDAVPRKIDADRDVVRIDTASDQSRVRPNRLLFAREDANKGAVISAKVCD